VAVGLMHTHVSYYILQLSVIWIAYVLYMLNWRPRFLVFVERMIMAGLTWSMWRLWEDLLIMGIFYIWMV